ncbi:MAG TPA: hypothetical protein VMR62_39510 [Bryobacteraceae bacterium]|nr:hypothetical protein [Bryobacteraceae bacterium]
MQRSLFTLAQRSQRETLRQARKCARLLAAVAVIALAGAPQVCAQAVGFVWNNNPTTAGTTTPDTAYSYNSSGGAISITRNAVGNYTALFAGLGNGLNSNVVVSGYGPGADFCIVESWFSTNGTDVDVNVLCFNKAGKLADHSFTALYQARMHGDPTTPTVAFLWANEPTTPSYTPDLDYQYNPGGGTNTIVRTSTGNYTATLPGLTQTGGTVIVTAYGSAPAHCQVTDWASGGSGTNVDVNCTNGTGVATDEEFSLVYSIFETAGYSPGSANGGAIWASKDKDNNPYDVSTRYSIAIDGEEMLAQRIGKGSYIWTMNVEDTWASSSVIVTAYDAPGNYCSTEEWLSSSTTTTVYVHCFSAAGAPTDTRFTATFQLAGVS